MSPKKHTSLAIAVAAFAMACADPSTSPTRTLALDGPSLALNPVPGYPFPSSPTDGLVTLCKISNAASTFTFNVTVNGVSAPGTDDVSIAVNAAQATAGTRVCAGAPLIDSDLESAAIENVVIAENDPGAGWATVIDIDQYFVVGLPYHASALADLWNTVPRQATVFINDDLEKRVTFRNTFTPPVLPSGGSITLQGGRFTLIGTALSGTFSIANTSGGQAVGISSATVLSPAVGKIAGGNETAVTISGCTITPVPWIIPQGGTKVFTISGCTINPAVPELNITVQAIVNNGSQPSYQRTYTVKAS